MDFEATLWGKEKAAVAAAPGTYPRLFSPSSSWNHLGSPFARAPGIRALAGGIYLCTMATADN